MSRWIYRWRKICSVESWFKIKNHFVVWCYCLARVSSRVHPLPRPQKLSPPIWFSPFMVSSKVYPPFFQKMSYTWHAPKVPYEIPPYQLCYDFGKEHRNFCPGADCKTSIFFLSLRSTYRQHSKKGTKGRQFCEPCSLFDFNIF